jgi:hypothetical protein
MTTLPRLAATLALLLDSASALANPSIAPGLWEHRMTMKSSDARIEKQMAEAQRAMATMPAEQRKMMEQMMAQQGISMPGAGGGGMSMKICITPEQASKQELPAPGERCTHRITGRTANALKFAVECPAEQARGEGETVFSGNKAYEGHFRMQRAKGGAIETMETQISARWIGATCGAIKPAGR